MLLQTHRLCGGYAIVSWQESRVGVQSAEGKALDVDRQRAQMQTVGCAGMKQGTCCTMLLKVWLLYSSTAHVSAWPSSEGSPGKYDIATLTDITSGRINPCQLMPTGALRPRPTLV